MITQSVSALRRADYPDDGVSSFRGRGSRPAGTEPEIFVTSRMPIRVIAEKPEDAATLTLMLSELGLPALEVPAAETCASWPTVITGRRFEAGFMEAVLTFAQSARLNRVVVFGSDMSTVVQASLHQAGFSAIVYSAPDPEDLLATLSAVDPMLAASRQATIARRQAAATAIEGGTERLFDHIRSGNLGRAVQEAKTAANYFETLLDTTAAAHWLAIIQQYHNGTAQHCGLVSAFAMQFARTLGFSGADQRRLFEVAHFHDVGKIDVPLSILDKPGALTPEERVIMDRHAIAGYDILARHPDTSGEIAIGARDHHEYLDGTGYPHGSAGKGISDIARIITICDIFAALLERRSYKKPKSAHEAYAILNSLDGKLDTTLVKAFGPIARCCASD